MNTGLPLSLENLPARVGQDVALGDWFDLSQAGIDAFADATGDHQWIHVDPTRAARESPYGVPIAHGMLVLSRALASSLAALPIDGVASGIVYGLDRVRFLAPAPAGSRARARFALRAWTPRPEGGQATWSITVEGDAADDAMAQAAGGTAGRPLAVCDLIVRYLVAGTPRAEEEA